MKVSNRVDGSVCGAAFSLRSSTAISASPRRRICWSSIKPSTPLTRLEPRTSRVCPKTSLWLQSTFLPAIHGCRLLQHRTGFPGHQNYSSAAAAAKPRQLLPAAEQDRDQLRSLVAGDPEGSVQEHFDLHRDPYLRGYAPPNTPQVHISDRKHDVEYPSREDALQASDEVQPVLSRLCSAITQSRRNADRATLEALYNLYAKLPEPRMLYLPWRWRNMFLRAMGTPKKRDMESMLRYFSLLADVKNAGISLRRTQWNFALAFATKYVARSTSREVESALHLWKEMERKAKIRGNDVTFNVLFDVAAKAGNFQLAELIYQEMSHRGIQFNRFHYVSLIHFFGLKLDSGGVRAAYREMVDAGEMVDTVVLNCVISGLLRCGEEAEAEETYRRMKDSHALAPEMPVRDYMMNKVVTKVLMMFSKVGKEHPQLKQSFQRQASISPDLHTYRLIVEHYAVKVGNLQKVAQYLDEMKYLKIQLHPTIFLALFKGFYAHGGFVGSDWSESRLQGVLSALYEARNGRTRGFHVDRWLVIWALRAVEKCSTSEAVMSTFDEMAQRWDVPPDRTPFLYDFLNMILQGRDMTAIDGAWAGPSYRRHKKDGSRL